ncbi:DUF6216 family protein [Escherichia coli]|uniref:DUF6216 family protein n=1 Tax=Escherichia coli TaxID=562 RepID=UPI002F2CCC11
MDIDKINAFLATAIGGLIFKWLAGGITSFWLWLNKSYPEEEFLSSKIGIAKPIIRLSLCRYKLNTKPHNNRDKVVLSILGLIVFAIALTGFYQFTHLIIKEPINWISLTHPETKDSFWMKPGLAKNRPDANEWIITPEVCLNKARLAAISSIKPLTKDFICSYMLSSEKKNELLQEANKNTFALMIIIPIVYLGILFFFMLGVGMFIDLFINAKITKFLKSEIERSYQYLT